VPVRACLRAQGAQLEARADPRRLRVHAGRGGDRGLAAAPWSADRRDRSRATSTSPNAILTPRVAGDTRRDRRRVEVNVNTRRGWRWTSLAALAVGLLWAASAQADVVRPPPQDCPVGSIGQTGHGGPYCAAARCSASAPCRTGVCQQTKLCLLMRTMGGGRRIEPRPPVETVTGSCAGNKKCSVGKCESVRVCVPKATRARQGELTLAGCGCTVGQAGVVGCPLLLGALVVVLALVRRRRRRG
jgi:MYXO-CTERM domain-containing protein